MFCSTKHHIVYTKRFKKRLGEISVKRQNFKENLIVVGGLIGAFKKILNLYFDNFPEWSIGINLSNCKRINDVHFYLIEILEKVIFQLTCQKLFFSVV